MIQPRQRGPSLLFAIGTGVALVVITLYVQIYGPLRFFPAWVVGGTFLFGGIPAYLSARYHLASPVFLAIGSYLLTLGSSWSMMVSRNQALEGGAASPPMLIPFEVLLVVWPLLLFGILVVSASEYATRRAMENYSEAEYTATHLLILAVVLTFLIEVLITAVSSTPFLSLDRIRTVTTGLFVESPLVAWTFSPLLHRDLVHVSSTIIGLIVVGIPVENHWSWKRYSAFIVLTAYATIAAGAGVLWLFSDPSPAFYGTSGVIYALAGFSLTHLPRGHDDLSRTEWLSVLIGAVALVSVGVDLFTGPYFEPYWINGGHTFGFIIGLVVGWFGWNSCCS